MSDAEPPIARVCGEVGHAFRAYPDPPAPVIVEASAVGCLVLCGCLRVRLFPVGWATPARHLEAEVTMLHDGRPVGRPELMATFRHDRRTGAWIVCVGTREYPYEPGVDAFVADVLGRVPSSDNASEPSSTARAF